MKKFKGLIVLLALLCVVLGVGAGCGCAKVTKNEVEINVVSSKITYHQTENISDVWFFLDILNGTNRALDGFNVYVEYEVEGGAVESKKATFENRISHQRMYGGSYSIYLEGKIKSVQFIRFEPKVATFGSSHKGIMIGGGIGAIVLGVLYAVFIAADIKWLVGAGTVLMLGVALLLWFLLSPVYLWIMLVLMVISYIPLLIYAIIANR